MEFTYDSGLVALSVGVAILGSFTGLIMTTGIRQCAPAESALRIVLCGLSIGGGVWAMHFIAMLAVELPIALSYDVTLTVLSATLAMLFTWGAIAAVSRRRFGVLTLPISALFLGVGIAGMHYMGMAALRGNCIVEYSWLGVIISIAIGIQASAIALWFAFRERGVLDTVLGAVALGLAIASMHYSAMEAVRFVPADLNAGLYGNLWSPAYMAFAIAITIYSICGFCILVYTFLTFHRRVRRY